MNVECILLRVFSKAFAVSSLKTLCVTTRIHSANCGHEVSAGMIVILSQNAFHNYFLAVSYGLYELLSSHITHVESEKAQNMVNVITPCISSQEFKIGAVHPSVCVCMFLLGLHCTRPCPFTCRGFKPTFSYLFLRTCAKSIQSLVIF